MAIADSKLLGQRPHNLHLPLQHFPISFPLRLNLWKAHLPEAHPRQVVYLVHKKILIPPRLRPLLLAQPQPLHPYSVDSGKRTTNLQKTSLQPRQVHQVWDFIMFDRIIVNESQQEASLVNHQRLVRPHPVRPFQCF